LYRKVDTARTSTEEFVKGLPTYRCAVEQIHNYCTEGVALKKKTINYMSEGGDVKPTKAYLKVSFIISVTGTRQQPGTSVRTDYLQTTFETGKDNRSTYVSAGVSLFNTLADKRNELMGTSKSNKKLVTVTF